MKKFKNIALLVGIGCNSILILWNILKSISAWFSAIDDIPIKYFFLSNILPIVFLILLMILPMILLLCNLKNKNVKILSIVTILVSVIAFAMTLFGSVTPAIPQYLIYSKIGLIDTYFTVLLSFFTSGGFVLLISHLHFIIGGVLSLRKKDCDF